MLKTILLAHGSRDPLWKVSFEELLHKLQRELGAKKIELAYLEFYSPSLEEVIAQAYKEGCIELGCLPLFMSKGAHLRNDVPELLSKLEAQYNGMNISLLDPIGEHPLMKNLILDIVKECVNKKCTDPTA